MPSSSSDSSSNPTQIIEHIVLLKVRPSAAPSAVTAMLRNLNSLVSLEPVLHISAGPISRCRSTSASLTFTHILHSRHRSKPHLTSYANHPTHVTVVSNYVRPIVDDVMAVDWVADNFSGSAAVPPGSAMRLTVLKLKEGAAEKRGKSEVMRGIKEKFPSIEQLSVGENFSPERAKGYSIGAIAVLKGVAGLDSEWNEQKDKVINMEFVDDVVVLDYLVPPTVKLASL
ncbi:hypothetical protein BUALT_Bualt09G0039200 [Buddleja alternifolia]|uniref:Stress-response A/B barrel domain-containing protein n=1 Tax=Buddleja alternifolia TaxID=168488 RepID=A0AAV6XAN0_9LAMI|nr:hypothetical protein BUALT_Bualt09G0039200 [Buddleja alternifolia]